MQNVFRYDSVMDEELLVDVAAESAADNLVEDFVSDEDDEGSGKNNPA